MRSSKVKYLGVFIVIVVFGIFAIPNIFNRINNQTVVNSNRSTVALPLSYVSLNGIEKKVPPFLLLNQDSLWISNEDFNGKVYVAEFFFTRCPSICPIMNKNMKKIEAQFGDRNDFGIASFSIDSKYDTPSVLKKYADQYEVFSSNWNFLTGENNVILELANRGFNIFSALNPDVAGGFEHQGYFALIDKNGFIRSRTDRFGNPIVYYMGIDQENVPVQDVDLLMEDIKKLLKE